MTIRLHLLALLSTMAAVLTPACSSSSHSNTDTDEGATTVDPTGNDQPGRLQMNLPSSTLALEPSTFSIGGKDYELGHASEPLPVGARGFAVDVKGTFASGSISGLTTIKANETVIGAMSLTAVDARTGPVTFGLRDANYQARPIATEFRVTISDKSDGSRAFPTWPGKHHVEFGLIDGIDYEVAENETKSIKLTDFATRRVMQLKAPHRENPAARCSLASDPRNPNDPNVPTWWVRAGSMYSSQQSLWWPETAGTIDFGASTLHPQDAYSFKASAWQSDVTAPLGKLGAGPLPFVLGHLDVNDVVVNGGAKVKGTYQVWPADSEGKKRGTTAFLGCSPETGTGVDLPAGKYVVEVYYSTVEAGQKTDVHVVDVTP